MDMSVNIAGIEWKNPVTVASGTFGSGAEFADYVDINKRCKGTAIFWILK